MRDDPCATAAHGVIGRLHTCRPDGWGVGVVYKCECGTYWVGVDRGDTWERVPSHALRGVLRELGQDVPPKRKWWRRDQ